MRLMFLALLIVSLQGATLATDLIPPVQEQSDSSGVFHWSDAVHIESHGNLQHEVEYLRDHLKSIYTIDLTNGGNAVSNGPRIVLAVRPANQDVPDHAEGYLLRITPTRIDLNSTSPAGIYYGVLTLKQLMAQQSDPLKLPACTIRDWPDLEWRAAFLNLRFVAAGEEHQQRLHDVIRGFAALKYNKLFIEIADNYNYRNWNWPDRATPAFNRDNLKALVDVARENHIELVPYLQTISHTLWIRSNAALWAEVKEGDTVKMWDSQYCPSNAKAVQLVREVISEQIEIFEPRYFHVGLDEAWEGPFGTCATCRQKDHVELYREAVMVIFDQLIKANIRPIAYNDGFNTRSGTLAELPPHGWKVIDQIPREVIIHAWDYSPELTDEFSTQLNWFSDKGFDVLGASFQRPRNVLGMPGKVKQNPRGLGTILTYWYDVDSWEKYDSISPYAWATTTLNAIASWKTDASDPRKINGDLIAPLHAEIVGHPFPRTYKSRSIDLSPYFNGRVGGDDSAIAGRPFSGALAQLNEIDAFTIIATPDSHNAIVMSGQAGDGLASAPVIIPLNRHVAGLRFVHTTERPFSHDVWNIDPNTKTQKPVVGRYRIAYADGNDEVIDLRYNWNIVDWNSPFSAFESHAIYRGEADDGSNLVITQHSWVNPRPDDVVISVSVETEQADGMTLVLLAMNAISNDLSAVVIDDFESPSQSASKNWRFMQDPASEQAQVKVVTEADGRKGVLQARLPAGLSDGSSRLMLDVPTTVPTGARQLSFWVHLGNPDALAQSAIYVGNDNFAKSAGQFRIVRLVGGWQQVVISLDGLSAIDPSEVTWVRISFWNKPQQPASIIYVDDVIWQKQLGRSADAQIHWYE